jgi:hypothetical protein
MVNFVNTNGYIEYSNPVSVQFNKVLFPRTTMQKSLFSNNAMVYYKKNGVHSGIGGSGVNNSRAIARRT